ncbi:hypothetical protein [Paraburkholderia fungorum]|uniref:hypothetical protein n=1 Tax=Paraburkholderia TaxID=1822464 RepID=UPI0038780015
MEPNLSPDELQHAVDSAAERHPLLVVLAWLKAGARPSHRGLLSAATEGRTGAFCALLDASDHEMVTDLTTCSVMLDNDDMLDAWLARVTPADLNRGAVDHQAPAWFRAFMYTPSVDDNDRADPARVARLPSVLAKLRDAGANLQSLEHDPDIGLNGTAEPDPHYDALRTLLRIPHERAVLRAVADEAMTDGSADQPTTATGRRRL